MQHKDCIAKIAICQLALIVATLSPDLVIRTDRARLIRLNGIRAYYDQGGSTKGFARVLFQENREENTALHPCKRYECQ